MNTNIDAVTICNRALVSIKAETIENLSEDTPSAIACNALYPAIVESLLSGYKWNFAQREAALALVSDITVKDWDYVYKYPDECLEILGIWYDKRYEEPPKYQVQYAAQIDASVICTNREKAILQYTGNITNPAQFSVLFRTAVQNQLALQLLRPLNSSITDAKMFETQFNKAVFEASTQNARASNPKINGINYLKQVRRGYPVNYDYTDEENRKN